MKKIEINGRIYSVTTMEEYTDSTDLYNPKFTAIEDHNVVLPIRSKLDNTPGYYYQQPDGDKKGMCCIVQKPENEQPYSTDKITDYTNPTNIGDILKNNALIKDIQSEIMTSGDNNVLHLTVGPNDTPEMKAIKTAINTKQVDKVDYQDRFSQFQNDMRLLKGKSITLGKLISICSAFDISAELTLRDKPDVPNPMNTTITVDLTEGRDDS